MLHLQYRAVRPVFVDGTAGVECLWKVVRAKRLIQCTGWGIFYTNSTVDLSAYSNGYLKFWLKSSGYTKVELQSKTGTNLATSLGASYGPTTNASGTAVWEQKSIPITNFTGIALNSIKSPFMVTDPTFDRAYYVDYVRWELAP